MLANDYINDPFDFSYNFDYELLNSFNAQDTYDIEEENTSVVSYINSQSTRIHDIVEDTVDEEIVPKKMLFKSEMPKVSLTPAKTKISLKKKYRKQNNTL